MPSSDYMATRNVLCAAIVQLVELKAQLREQGLPSGPIEWHLKQLAARLARLDATNGGIA